MATKPILPIFFATDDGYAAPLGIALESLLANTHKPYDIRIHILTTSLSPLHEERLAAIVGERATLSFIDMTDRIAEVAERLVLRDYYSSTTYFRLFISELFPEYDKVLYLDSDIVVTGDVADLFETPLDGALVGAAPEDVMRRVDVFGRYVEVCLGIPRDEYFNAGVLVMNLAAFREQKILDRFVELLSHRRYAVTQDEDYLNVLCRGAVVPVGYTWNTSPLAVELSAIPTLIHYKLDRKPWHYTDIHFGEQFWQYAAATPYYEDLLAGRDAYGEADIARDRHSYERLCRLAEDEVAEELAAQEEARRHKADCIA